MHEEVQLWLSSCQKGRTIDLLGTFVSLPSRPLCEGLPYGPVCAGAQ